MHSAAQLETMLLKMLQVSQRWMRGPQSHPAQGSQATPSAMSAPAVGVAGSDAPRAPTEARRRSCRRWVAAGCRHLAVARALSLLAATGAQAGANPCDDFMAVLAARIESTGVRGYSLEVVPAGTAVPPGARAIATCESGARRILYRRWGGARVSSGAASAARTTSEALLDALPDDQARRVPVAREARATLAPVTPVPALVQQAPEQPSAAASAVAMPAAESVRPAVSGASEVVAKRPVDRMDNSQPAPANTDRAPEAMVAPTSQALGFVVAHWPWIVSLMLLLLLGWVWLRNSYFSAYDKDGLPRGPRL